MIFFNATTSQQSVELKWATATEINFDYFILEHSTDGQLFTKVAEIPGAGNSQTRRDYSFLHTNPSDGINYYRLREVDFDNVTTGLGIVSAVVNVGKHFSVFPNPVSGAGDLTFQINFELQSNAIISVTDLSGHVRAEITMNNSELNGPVSLPPGIYIVNFRSSEYQSVSRIVVK